MSSTGRPGADGERSAVVGYSGQYLLAARVVVAKLHELDWIKVADPQAGAVDDFQFGASGARHAVQVKWAQYPGAFQWSRLASQSGGEALLRQLADGWRRLQPVGSGPVTIHLRSNEFASITRPARDSALGRCGASGPRHLAAFIARSLEPVSASLREGSTFAEATASTEYTEWQPAWAELETASGLSGADFLRFMADLRIVLGQAVDEPLAVDPERVGDVRHVAMVLQQLVADPARPVHLERGQFLEALGWSDRVRYRHRHQFPVPAVYEANRAAREHLLQSRSTLPGGYIGLIGPAGSGKSTLLASMDWPTQDRVCRYFAFVPDSPDPLSGRGEATSFLHDLSLALENSGLHRVGYGHDLASQRAVLMDQLERAGRRWSEDGTSTVVVIDGLDHVPREQRPERSMLLELPPPQALPEGVFVVLGSQTTEIFPASVTEGLRTEGRIVELPPLTQAEVTKLANASGHGEWLQAEQMSLLLTCSEGHPLALTYLLRELDELAESEPSLGGRRARADELLTGATSLGPDVEARYRGYFQAVAANARALSLLARLSRLRHPVDLHWVATWADADALAEFERQAVVFFWRSGSTWRFIHNSFRRFLTEATATTLSAFDSARDAAIHGELADTCAGSASAWPVYGDEEIAHRFLAGQHDLVLRAAAPTELRHRLAELRPVAVVQDHLRIAMRSAAATRNLLALTQLLMFHSELSQRSRVVEASVIARMVSRAMPGQSLEHVTAAGQLRVDEGDALAVAVGLAREGHSRDAALIVRAAGDLRGVVSDRSSSRGDAVATAVADWAEVRLRLSGLEEVLAELNSVIPLTSEPPPEEEADQGRDDGWRERRESRDAFFNSIYWRNSAHARCLDVLVEERFGDGIPAIGRIIDGEASVGWRARVRLIWARAAANDGDLQELIRLAEELIAIGEEEGDEDDEDASDAPSSGAPPAVPLGLRLHMALLLFGVGLGDHPAVGTLVPDGAQAQWPSSLKNDDGLRAYRAWMELRTLRSAQGKRLPAPDLSRIIQHASDRSQGTRRVVEALALLADLEGDEIRHRVQGLAPAIIAGSVDSIVRLFEVPTDQTHEWTSWYLYRPLAAEIFGQVLRLAARVSPQELNATLARFREAWADPDRTKYWGAKLRASVIEEAAKLECDITLLLIDLQGAEQALVSETLDLHSRVEASVAIGETRLSLGQAREALASVSEAVRTSMQLGAVDGDPQMGDWLRWIEHAHRVGAIETARYLEILSRLAAHLVVADGMDARVGDVGERVVALAWTVSPALATALNEHLCEEGVLTEPAAVRCLLRTAMSDSRCPALAVAGTSADFHIPMDQHEPSALLEPLRARSHTDEVEAAERLLREALETRPVAEGDGEGEGGEAQSTHTEDQAVAGTAETSTPVTSAPELLAALRDLTVSRSDDEWAEAFDRVPSPSASVGRTIAAQALEREFGGRACGAAAAFAAKTGGADLARSLLADGLARTPIQGWMRHWDGGSRQRIVVEAIRHRDPELIDLVVADLVDALVTDRLYEPLSPRDVLEVMSVAGGVDLMREAVGYVTAYLDVLAPLATDQALVPVPPDPGEPVGATVAWLSGYLGHPTWVVDHGTRRALLHWLDSAQEPVQSSLAVAIEVGGWPAEAALMCVLLAGEGIPRLEPNLRSALERAAVGPDQIIRELAAQVAAEHRVDLPLPGRRPLPPSYQIALPPLPPKHAPALDRHGVPFVDYSDPQQVTAPFDVSLKVVAEALDLEESTVLHRGAGLARGRDDRWLAGGHQAHADCLRRRGQKHTYRPWAYMSGRRALGEVLAELIDARVLGDVHIARKLGSFDTALATIDVRPLTPAMPTPWRPPDTQSYDVKGWCDEVQQAAKHYADAVAVGSEFVLAEYGEWQLLEWGSPSESRNVTTRHRSGPDVGISLPVPRAWEASVSGAARYPRASDLEWAHQELVMRGREVGSDARWLEWVALHPRLARELGWTPDDHRPFGWLGSDGNYRAWTVRRERGQLSDQPPSNGFVAAVWQVVLSPAGQQEISAAFGRLVRTVELKRVLPARPRESRPVDQVATASCAVPPSTSRDEYDR